ncbi:hypothetical protein HD806DRAFT_533930 [Xylariaceae sp. AK1471]|nr:hypothetical protein HD806DRAFT_533930 [Xylariaceae sp. AK1471]
MAIGVSGGAAILRVSLPPMEEGQCGTAEREHSIGSNNSSWRARSSETRDHCHFPRVLEFHDTERIEDRGTLMLLCPPPSYDELREFDRRNAEHGITKEVLPAYTTYVAVNASAANLHLLRYERWREMRQQIQESLVRSASTELYEVMCAQDT